MSASAAAPTAPPTSTPASAPGSSNRHGSNIIAVSFVVEGSLAISSTWSHYLLQYIGPIMKNIQETVPALPGAQVQFMISFVTYGLRDTHPSPIITKRFFSPIRPSILAEMREGPTSLGYDKAPYPDADGTSALEGLVAAIEMFSTLHSTYKPDATISSYIVHVASGTPDDSLHPTHNNDPELDAVTWETLPNELKKRNIQYCAILQMPIQRFVDIHAAIPGPRARLSLAVRPPDIVLPPSLSNTSSPSPTKRMAPNQASPSEIKRSKTERPGDSLSSPLTHATPPVVHHPTFPTANSSNNNNNNNNTSNPSAPPVLSDPVKNSISQKTQQLLSILKQLGSERNVAVVAGNTSRVGQIDQEIENQLTQVKQMRMLLAGQPAHSGVPPPGPQQQQPPPPSSSSSSSSVQDVKASANANAGSASAPAAAVAPPAIVPKAPVPSNNNAPASNPAARPPAPAPAAPSGNPAASTSSSLSTPASLPTWDKDIGDHMQSVVNNVANLQRVSVAPPQVQPTAQPAAQMLPSQVPGNPTVPAPQPPTSMPPVPGQANAAPPGQKKWRGVLLLSISDSAARNQITIEVASVHDHDCSNWSAHILVRLVPQIRTQVLQNLVSNRTVATVLAPENRQTNNQANLEAFGMLQRLLMVKSWMAIGIWPRPNSQSEKRAIFMPRGNALVMFVFPHGPMPEIDLRSNANLMPVPSASAQQQSPSSMPGAPGSSSVPQHQPSASSPSVANAKPPGLTPAQIQKLMALPADQRQRCIERFRQGWVPGGDPASMQGNPGNAAALAAFTQRQIPPTAAGGAGAGAGGLSATEIMQQFMQRGQGDGAA